jgi:hypothetical protein
MKLLSVCICIFIILITGCNQSRSKENEAFLSSDTENLSNNIGDTLEFDKEFVLKNYFSELSDSLLKDKIPVFLYDECLDAKEIAYCNMGSHKSQSLRYNIINNLTLNQLGQILEISDVNRLKNICNVSYAKEQIFGEKSTYFIIDSVKREKEMPRR